MTQKTVIIGNKTGFVGEFVYNFLAVIIVTANHEAILNQTNALTGFTSFQK